MSFSANDLSKRKKTHQCDFCDKFFTTASNMREHRRTHTGEKPFVCRYCGKAFAQSSTHSKHQLVHKSKEKLRSGGKSRSVEQTNRQCQEQDMLEPCAARLGVSSASQFHAEPSTTFVKTLENHEQSKMKTEVEFFNNSDWHSSVLGGQADATLQFSKICDASVSSLNRVTDNEQTSFADQKPIITGMFKNRACNFLPSAVCENLQVKQEVLDVKKINFKTSSLRMERGSLGAKDSIQCEKAENKARGVSTLFFNDANTVHGDDSKLFHSALPQSALSKEINRDDRATWNDSREGTSIIQLDLTSDADTLLETQDKFQSNIETFFKCIHCSETFSSLEEHICLAKEAKMFFKCQVCLKTFSQYGPFVRHKKSHENPKQFTVSSSLSDISMYKAEEYKTRTMADKIQKEPNDISQITNSLHSRTANESSHPLDLLATSFPNESNRIQSSTQLIEEEENSNDDVIIIEEDTIEEPNRYKDVLKDVATVEKPREKSTAIPTYANPDQFNNIEAGYFERSNLSTNDMGKSRRRAQISDALLKPNAVEKKSDNVSRLVKRQAHWKKNAQQIGKKVYPFTCLFCPRKFSTASNMREHMRIHTGEKPFSCEMCHKKFAQSSTRSKHMQIHTRYKMSGGHMYGKKFTQSKNYKKHLRKPEKHPENPKSFSSNRFANIREKPKVYSIKSSSMKASCNKNYSSLMSSKANRPSLKKYAPRMLSEPNHFSFPPKTGNNKTSTLNAKSYKRDDTDITHLPGYNKESTNRTNISPKKMDCIVEHNNNQNLKNKMSFPLDDRLDSNISLFASSFGNSKTQTEHLLPSTSTVFPRPKSRHRGVHKLLRNARSYRPFRCTYCPRTFSTSGNMKEHMRTHTGEKPFRCEYCHRRFAQSSTHSKHVQVHIRKQQLNCLVCGKFFSQVALLRSHIITDHKAMTENSSRNGSLSTNLYRSSNPAIINKSGTGFSFGSNSQSESFLDPQEKNPRSQEAKVRKDDLAIPDSNIENVSNFEVDSLADKRLFEVDLPADRTGFLIHDKNESFLSLRESEESNSFPEKCKRDSAKIPKIGKDAQENIKSIVTKDPLISKSNLSSSIAEGACVPHHLDSEMFGELLTKHAWPAMSANVKIPQESQNQMKSGAGSAVELTQINANNSELSPIIELGSIKSLAKETNLFTEVRPPNSSSSVDDLNTGRSFSVEEELNRCTSSGEQMINKIYLDDYCPQDPLINLSAESHTDSKQKRPTKLQLGSPQNINEDFVLYNPSLSNLEVEFQVKRNSNTGQPSDQYIQSKVDIYDSFLDKEKKLHQQKVYPPLLNHDQLSSSPNSFNDHFIPSLINSLGDHIPANSQINTMNKARHEDALHSLNYEQENISSQMTSCERSLSVRRGKISLGLPSHRVEQSLDLSDTSGHKAREENVLPLLDLNPCSGDSSKKLNWLSDIVPKTKTEREEPASDFTENHDSQFLAALQEDPVAVLSSGIKLEMTIPSADATQSYMVKDTQFENEANSDLPKAASVGDSLDLGFNFNVSDNSGHVQSSVTTETDGNEIMVNMSRPFCNKVETISQNNEAAVGTNFAGIRSLESTSVCVNIKDQQLLANRRLPNNVATNLAARLERKRRNLQQYKIAGKFKCVYCNRSFSSRSNMKEHMRIHTGEKPFECVFCFRRFAQSSTHSKHVQIHLRFRQLVCPQCGRRFHQLNNLCQHIKTHHRNSQSSATSPTKKNPICLDTVSQTPQASSCQQDSYDSDKHLYTADSYENSPKPVNIDEASLELYEETKTRNEAADSNSKHFVAQQSCLPFLNNKQTSNEDGPTQEVEKTTSTTDMDLEKTNLTSFSAPNENTANLQDVSFDTINFHLNQSDFPLNNSSTALPKRNDNPQFSSEQPISNAIGMENNLQKQSDTSSDEKSSNGNIDQQTSAQPVYKHEKPVCETSDMHKSDSDCLLDVSDNDIVGKIQSPRFEFKCDICSEEFSSDRLLNHHQRYHIVNLAKRRGFDVKDFNIGELNLRNYLSENKIKSLAEFEESFDKVASDLGLAKLQDKPCQVQPGKLFQQISNKENTENVMKQTDNNYFKSIPNLPVSHLSSLPSSTVSPASVVEPMKEQKKKGLMLHFHRCLFCSKMFDALINLQEHLRTHVEEPSSLASKYDRKLRECSAWYKHVEIVLGGRLKLPTGTIVENAQHLKIMFDVGARLKMLMHRNLYKCKQCPKECATFQSLLYHRQTHSRRLTGRKIPTLASEKLTKRTQGPSGFLQKRPTSSLIFSLEHVSSASGGKSSTVEDQTESHKTSLPLLYFSVRNQFWLVNLNGNLQALRSYSRRLPMTESNKQHLRNMGDSQQKQYNENFTISLSEESENATPINKCHSDDKLESPLQFSPNNLKDGDTKTDLNDHDDDSTKNKEVTLSESSQFSGVNNSGVRKVFGQELTNTVSLQLEKCVDCGKMFTNVGPLKKHLEIHTGKSPFQCNLCPKSFTNSGTYFRHKSLTHLRPNPKSCIQNCRNNKFNSKSGLRERLKSKCCETKPQSALDMNLADVDTAYLADLVKKVLGGNKTPGDFSQSSLVHKLSIGAATTLSEMNECPSRLSDKQPTEGCIINQSSEPFHSQDSNLDVGIMENCPSENKESVDEINFLEDDLNKTAEDSCAAGNSLFEVQIKKEVEGNFASLNSCKADYTSVKRKPNIFSHNQQEGDVGLKEKMFPSQSSHHAKNQVDFKHNSDKEAQIIYRVGNESTVVPNTDATNGFDEKHLKDDKSVECIFIHDDPDDHSSGEPCILDVGSSLNRYLPNCNDKMDTTSEIIIVSDEENDDNSIYVKMQSANDRASLINLCNNTDDVFVGRLKENQIEDRPKTDSELFPGVCNSVAMSFKTGKSSFPEVSNPKRNDSLGIIPAPSSSTSSLEISSIANSTNLTDLSLKKTSSQSRSSSSSKVHACLYCSKTCSSASNLKEHMRSHTGERPFSCSVCHKRFAQKSTLSKHTQIHTRLKKFLLENAAIQESFHSYDLDSTEPTPVNSLKPPLGLVEHFSTANQFRIKNVSNVDMESKDTTFQSHTNQDSRETNADVCDSFDLIDDRSDIKPIISFEDDQSDMTQPSEIVHNLSSHYQLLASGIYTLPQSSANIMTGKQTLMKANPMKPQISDVVPEVSVTNKPYLCDICDRTFTTSGNLKEHRRTHTGERPFECPFCEKTFAQASTRSRHVKNHSKHFVNHF